MTDTGKPWVAQACELIFFLAVFCGSVFESLGTPAYGRLDASLPAPLEGFDILDVGCGGGILAESLAKRGASVLGIDVNEEGLAIARTHAAPNPRISQLCTYEAITVEKLAARGAKFDVGRCTVHQYRVGSIDLSFWPERGRKPQSLILVQ